jgi:hypothetical protein
VLGHRERACAGAERNEGGQQLGLAWGQRRKGFCPYISGEEVSWTRGDNVATQRVKGRLHPGLDGALSAPTAQPVKRAAQGPRH